MHVALMLSDPRPCVMFYPENSPGARVSIQWGVASSWCMSEAEFHALRLLIDAHDDGLLAREASHV